MLENDETRCNPKRYILRHWTRALIPIEEQDTRGKYGEVDSKKDEIINNLYNQLDIIVSHLWDDKELLMCGDILDDMKKKVGGNDFAFSSAKDKADAFHDCYRIDQPSDDDIIPPSVVRNKGCGKGKRLVGAIEEGTSKTKGAKRLCRSCGEHVNQDSRNCPFL
ncbi:hypothetical protein OSB04_010882 [Centaurea solstitialis]|uniref:Uncharacterized protein n=1 Tax=Centaurea solstitialis TaxID=347529 RepID=A0AA38TT56_9ASTR|nr:hypothetical protein OSB04_010882 [Centaurea solstitialis]